MQASPVLESTVKLAVRPSPATSFVTVIAIGVAGSPAKIGNGTEVPTTAGLVVIVVLRLPGMSVEIPHWVTTKFVGDEEGMTNQVPLDGRHTDMSVFPSPS